MPTEGKHGQETYERRRTMSQVGNVHELAERVFREESGRIIATLIRVFNDFDLAEDAMQDALITALDRWPRDGVPDNPGAWITTTARRKAIDRLRRDRVGAEKQLEVARFRADYPDGVRYAGRF